MGIIYCEKDRTFTLQTKETTDFFFISTMAKRQRDAWIIF